jgi:hypothetical protein
MLKKDHKPVVIGPSGTNSAFDSLLMPGGEHALVVDRQVYMSALKAADKKFSEFVKDSGAISGRTGRRKPAA